MGLGAAVPGEISLTEARDVRNALRLNVKSGNAPLEERASEAAKARQEAQATKASQITFKEVAKGYIAANENNWKNAKHRQQWRNTLVPFVYPEIGDTPVGETKAAHVLRILEPIWKTKSETASRIRGRIEKVLNSAKARGYRKGENPALWRGHLEQILPPRS